MNTFTPLRSLAVPLPLQDIDTDLIIPAQYLTSVSRNGFGADLFARLREAADFPLNQARFRDAKILVTGRNFGCGSSREHAVWALLEGGFRAVIAPSFADIFHSNSAQNGLLLVTLPDALVQHLLQAAANGDYLLELDLLAQTVTLPGGQQHHFPYDPFRKHCLLHGLDDLDYILSHRTVIDTFRTQQAEQRFFSTLHPARPS